MNHYRRRGPLLMIVVCAPVLLVMAMARPSADGDQTGSDERGSSPTSAPSATSGEEVAFKPFSAGLVGSKHDFTDSGRVPRDLCLPCHTPHITAGQAPLRGGQRTTTQPAPTALGYQVSLSPASLLCLSCHDGIIAPDVYGGSHAMVWSDRAGGGVQPGLMRLTSHPVGIAYPDNNPKYNPATAVTTDGRLKLPGGRVQCTTCHDPHNSERHAGLLTKSNARSALCLTCHKL